MTKGTGLYMAHISRYLSHQTQILKITVINIFKKIDDKMENFTRELVSIVKNKIVLAEKSSD